MVGGFSFKLSPFDDQPHLRIKHRNSRSAFFKFAQPAHQDTPRSIRQKRRKRMSELGRFLDLKTLAAALTSTSHSVRSLAEHLGVARKGDYTDFEKPINAELIAYALRDTQVTYECYAALMERFKQHELRIPAHRVYSEAGLGKAYLEEMGIKPWRDFEKDFDPEVLGAIMSSYFGGRAEIHIRRQIVPAIYCDFASMYPTVCTLMGLWRFVIAQGVDHEDASTETQAFLDNVRLERMQKPEAWGRLTTLVQVLPDSDIFPVRTRYAKGGAGKRKPDDMPTIGVNYLSADRPLWFTLADCVASKLLTGKAPKVVRAVKFTPREPQATLRPIRIAGNHDFEVRPAVDDFYKRVIELRRTVKARQKAAEQRDRSTQEAKNLEMEQLALKILANATSYGIFIELNVEDNEDDEVFGVHAAQGSRVATGPKREQPGRFFHPLLATLITGAARLMLAICERLARDRGLEWAFCDTDSMAFANVSAEPPKLFESKVSEISEWFVPLNPYEQAPGKPPVSILEPQKQNLARDGSGDFEPLYCFAISAKRYVLFNLDQDGRPIIRKASAHGLGHYLAPYAEENETRGERESGVRRWEEDVWTAIIQAARSEKPGVVDYEFRPEMKQPARSRYSATGETVLLWFQQYNEGKPYAQQVKPFNFLLQFYALRQEDMLAEDSDGVWDSELGELAPVAPFDRDLSKALPKVFDRNSAPPKPVPAVWLRSVANVLRDYHRQPEHKFLGGGWIETGILRRRHIFAERVEDIGKESEGWEEDDANALNEPTVITYGLSADDINRMRDLILRVPKTQLMRVARIAMRTIDAVHRRDAGVSEKDLRRMADVAGHIAAQKERLRAEQEAALEWLNRKQAERSLAQLARDLGLDKANLLKVIKGERKLSKALARKIGEVDES
jgi:hypothetical protein